jgi:hypothetical protein
MGYVNIYFLWNQQIGCTATRMGTYQGRTESIAQRSLRPFQ